MTYIISVLNEKGGVGKTTTVVSLGGAFAQLKKKTLLIDLDEHAGLTNALSIYWSNDNHYSIVDVYNQRVNLSLAILDCSVPNLNVVLANSKLSQVNMELLNREKPTILRDMISGLYGYDVILLDCPPTLGAVALTALVASNLVIIPTQMQYLSIKAALKQTVKNVSRIANKFNPDLSYRILVNMLDRRIKNQIILLDQLKSISEDRLFKTTISQDSNLIDSQITGLPITAGYPRSRSAKQYIQLAQEILDDAI